MKNNQLRVDFYGDNETYVFFVAVGTKLADVKVEIEAQEGKQIKEAYYCYV